MRPALTFAAALLAILAGCAPQRAERAGAPARPHAIVVREFAFLPGIVNLDPSFGFSLHRGEPGVPARRRAETVGRAAAFTLADTIARQLVAAGYDAVRADAAAPIAATGGRMLVVTGAFRRIDEGRRRRVGAENAAVAVAVEIDSRTDGAAPRQIMTFPVDSRRLPPDPEADRRRGADVNDAAARVGRAIARTVSDLARLNRWPAVSR